MKVDMFRKPIRARWQQHVKGQHNWRDSLWLVLMWQAFLQSNHLESPIGDP